jgi:amino-acid N-acetyltransferase
MENSLQFVQWLRSVAPYIHAFRGKTFVVAFPGELVKADALPVLAQDLSLLHALGIKIVIVHGSRPQVEEQLALRNVEGHFHNGIRITDIAALECAKEAAGELRLDIEAAFSQGLPNTPMAHAAISIISGNFVTARPLGIVDGIDLQLTGQTRKIAYETIDQILRAGSLVLLSPLGFSPTGEAFNLTMEDVAVSAARHGRASSGWLSRSRHRLPVRGQRRLPDTMCSACRCPMASLQPAPRQQLPHRHRNRT